MTIIYFTLEFSLVSRSEALISSNSRVPTEYFPSNFFFIPLRLLYSTHCLTSIYHPSLLQLLFIRCIYSLTMIQLILNSRGMKN